MLLVIFIMTILYYPIYTGNISSICGVCECLGDSLVECDNLQLTQIPEIEGDAIRRLSFSGNSLSTISKLPHLQSLQVLSFRFNVLTNIEHSAFSDLPNLTSLDLSYNNLSADSFSEATFKGPIQERLDDPLQTLKSLNLSSNHLKRLTKEMFSRLTNLSVLSLRHNPFQDFSSCSLIAFSELPLLEELDLAYTGLRRLPNHIFADLRSLKILDLTGNEFDHIPTEVNFVPSLRNLILNNQLFTSIAAGYFYESLQNLESLQISYSPLLAQIENYAFANLTGLRKLIITHNPHLHTLQAHCLSTKLNNTLYLEEVQLTHNHLQSLPRFAVEWTSISSLDLQNNPWKCDCNFEWAAKGLIPEIAKKHKELTLYIVCASPLTVMGKSVLSTEIQETKLLCYNSFPGPSTGASISILMVILIGVLLLCTGTILFSYALYKRTQSQEWTGSNIHYRRVNEPVLAVVP